MKPGATARLRPSTTCIRLAGRSTSSCSAQFTGWIEVSLPFSIIMSTRWSGRPGSTFSTFRTRIVASSGTGGVVHHEHPVAAVDLFDADAYPVLEARGDVLADVVRADR